MSENNSQAGFAHKQQQLASNTTMFVTATKTATTQEILDNNRFVLSNDVALTLPAASERLDGREIEVYGGGASQTCVLGADSGGNANTNPTITVTVSEYCVIKVVEQSAGVFEWYAHIGASIA